MDLEINVFRKGVFKTYFIYLYATFFTSEVKIMDS